jgi:serine/threonine-protein kinase RsbW
MKPRVVEDEFVVSNKTENLSQVRDFVGHVLTRARINETDARHIVLAVDEAVSNIIRHGYEEFTRGTRTVQMHIHADTTRVEVVLRDSGRKFDPNSVPSPCIADHVKLGRRYGLGLFLMRRVMDEVKYVFKSRAENTLTMVKYVERSGKEKQRGSGGGKNGRSKAQEARTE